MDNASIQWSAHLSTSPYAFPFATPTLVVLVEPTLYMASSPLTSRRNVFSPHRRSMYMVPSTGLEPAT